MKIENLIAVVVNIYGINMVTRYKIKGALERGERDLVHEILEDDPKRPVPHIRAEVHSILVNMLAEVEKFEAIRTK